MKIYRGIEELIRNKDFFLAEDEDEEFDLEDTKSTWLEAPMFLMIWTLRGQASPAEVIEAAIYYLENDTFMEPPFRHPGAH